MESKVLVEKIKTIIGSRRFFYGVLAFFTLESLWVALSARYPMAFDEDFHMGIIKIYSHHWLPFLSGQPDGGNQYGAVARDPSFLYHYLMSFPYRVLAAITDSQTIQIIVLRLLNIPLVALALVLFRRLLRRVGMPATFSNAALAVFVLIPILPLLAGQVNYDNLVLPLVAGMCLLGIDVYQALRRQEVPVVQLGWLVIICLGGSIVKYAFLPMVLVTVGLVLAGVLHGFGLQGWRRLQSAWITGYRQAAGRTLWLLALAIIVLAGLFIQRYGVNTFAYHTPIPACDDVLSSTECSEYGPWNRNNLLAQSKTDINTSRLLYTWHWLQALHYRLFFTVNGPYDDFRNYPPMPLPAATAVLLAVSGVVALALAFKRVFSGRPLLVYLFCLALFYGVVLWAEDYSQFVETGQPVAINGRYLLPVLLPLAAVFGRALYIVLARLPRVKVWATVAVLLLLLQGGGAISFILRSDAAWYWPGPVVWHANNVAQHITGPFVIEGSKYY